MVGDFVDDSGSHEGSELRIVSGLGANRPLEDRDLVGYHPVVGQRRTTGEIDSLVQAEQGAAPSRELGPRRCCVNGLPLWRSVCAVYNDGRRVEPGDIEVIRVHRGPTPMPSNSTGDARQQIRSIACVPARIVA